MLAYGDSTLARLGRDAFLDLFGRVPSLAQYLHRNMAYDLCEKIMISSARTLLTARGLAAFDLLRRQALLEDMDVPLPPQKIWAATLGLTRETLSRGLSTLVKDKTIVIEGNLITICDLESLRQAGT